VADVRVLLGGEGNNELGVWNGRAQQAPGVLEALLRRVRADGWSVGGARQWKDIRKYRAGSHRTADQRNVLGLALEATERGCNVLAFSRDADTATTDSDIADAVSFAATAFPTVAIIGRLAKPMVEGWILALSGDADTDKLSKPKANARIVELEIEHKSTAAYVAVVETADLAHGRRAPSLCAWLDTADAVLPVTATR
jgi:hypothetical protein